MKLDELLASRRTAKFYLGDEESPADRLARILPSFSLTPEQVGQIVEAYYTARVEQTGPAITLRSITKTENDQLRAMAKKKPAKLINPAKPELGFTPEEIDQEDFVFLTLAKAIVEPEVEGADPRAKADHLASTLTIAQAFELFAAVDANSRFNLQRAQDLVKN